MKCYFCQFDNKEKKGGIMWCDRCAQQYDIQSVITTYVDNKVATAQLFLPREKDGTQYYIRLEMYDDITYITRMNKHGREESDNPDSTLTFKGLLFTPQNVKKKLKTYILFS